MIFDYGEAWNFYSVICHLQELQFFLSRLLSDIEILKVDVRDKHDTDQCIANHDDIGKLDTWNFSESF